MTYIRTEDRIYELESDYLNNKGVRVGYNVVGQEEVVLIENNSIIQADTIEEICDLFIDVETKTIFHKYNGNGYVINWRTNLVYSLKALVKEFHSIKGAIYTDEGLIYVTKMNQEGDFVLL